MRGLLHPLERRSGWLWPGEGRGGGAVLVQTGPDADVGRASSRHDPRAGGEAELCAGGGGLCLVMLEQGGGRQGGLVLGEGGHGHREI